MMGRLEACLLAGLSMAVLTARASSASGESRQAPKTWGGPLMATDALGRTVADRRSGAPKLRGDRKVGMFYFLWEGEHGRHAPIDVSKIIASDPWAGFKPELWGAEQAFHHWGEPFYGYYCSDDEWVVRHHMKLMIQAGIDFLYFDVTNGSIYEQNAKLVMRVLDEYRKEGWKTPGVVFYTTTFYTSAKSGETLQKIYDRIYKTGYCPDTWYRMEGKPVAVAQTEECSPEVRAFFHIVRGQWPEEPMEVGGWPWMDFHHPQMLYRGENGQPSVMNVSVAQNCQIHFSHSALYGETGNCGRAYHDFRENPDPNAWKKGLNFAEQFDHAIKTDPDIVMVTGWNEWIAQRQPGTVERPINLIDCATPQYSRDLEMMRGGYFDNYFMLLVDKVRRYKGVVDYPVHHALGKESFGDARRFLAESAAYDAFSDGGFVRHAAGYGTVYNNETPRNVLTRINVGHDQESLRFCLTTSRPIELPTDTGGWMELYLNVTGKGGYQYVVKPSPAGGAALGKILGNGDSLASRPVPGVNLECRFRDNRMVVTIPGSAIGLGLHRPFSLWFKCADSKVPYENISDFYEKGHAEPLGRLNFTYSGD